MSASSAVVGNEVAKAHVDVAPLSAELDVRRFNNHAEGHSPQAAALKPLAVALVMMKAGAGYEADLACALQADGLPRRWSTHVRRVNLSSRCDACPRPMRSMRHAGAVARGLAAPRRSVAAAAAAAQAAAAMAGRTGETPAPGAEHALKRAPAACHHAQGPAPKHPGHHPRQRGAARRHKRLDSRARA